MRLALLSGLFAPLLVASDAPVVTVEEGTKVTKTFENSLRIELAGITIELDDEEMPAPDELPEVTISDDEEIVFVDEYVSVDGGRGTVLLRTFETLSDSSTQAITLPNGEGEESTTEGESDLEGLTVRFAWDEDDEEYSAEFAEGDDADEDLLEDLEGDADFLFLMPDEEVEVGDSWDLDAEIFTLISSPSGDLKIDSEESDDTDDEFSEQFEDNLSGDFEATLESIEDGVATIKLEGSVSTEIEIEDELPDEAPEGLDSSQTFEFSFDVTATLLWDLEAGVASSFELSADVEMENARTQTFEETTLVQTQSFEGTYESRATFE